MAKSNNLIKDVEFSWAKLVTPFKNQFGGENYEITITVPADRAQEVAQMVAKEGKPTEDGRVAFGLKRKAVYQDGRRADAPRVVNTAKEALDGMKIGNGSKGNIIVQVYDYEFAGNAGKSHSIEAVQVTELVEYNAAPAVDFEDAAGSDSDAF